MCGGEGYSGEMEEVCVVLREDDGGVRKEV